MPKDSKEALKHARSKRAKNRATFASVCKRLGWMENSVKLASFPESDTHLHFLFFDSHSPLRDNRGLKLTVCNRSVKNHPETEEEVPPPLLQAIKKYLFQKNFPEFYYNIDVRTSMPPSPTFAKGETMHIVGIGNGYWKLAEAAPKAEEVVDQHGGFIGKLTPSQRSVLQHGCTQCDPTTAGTCVDCVALRKKGLLEGPE